MHLCSSNTGVPGEGRGEALSPGWTRALLTEAGCASARAPGTPSTVSRGTVSNQAAVFPGIQTLRLGLGLGVRDGGLHTQERRPCGRPGKGRPGVTGEGPSLLCPATPLPTWLRAVVCRERGRSPTPLPALPPPRILHRGMDGTQSSAW